MTLMIDASSLSQLQYHRIYSDARAKWGWYGESHFDLVKIKQSLVNAAPPAPPLYLSGEEPASKYVFYSFEPGWIGDWHPAPARQFMVLLSGTVEIETSDGNIQRFKPGDILLLEDTWGKGHRLRNTGEEYLHFFVVQLPVV